MMKMQLTNAVMRTATVMAVAMGFMSTTAHSSSLRIQSMGSVGICTDDASNDSITVNPARAALINQRQVQLWGGPETYSQKTINENTLPSNGQLKGDSRSSEESINSFNGNLLAFCPVRDNFTLGLYAYSSKIRDNDKSSRSYSGRSHGSVTVSTETYLNQEENSTESDMLSVDLLGGIQVKEMYVGLLIEHMFPYTYRSQHREDIIDNSFYDTINTAELTMYRNETKESAPYNVKAGVLFFPSANSSVDIVVNPYSYTSSERRTLDISSGVDFWSDDLTAYPRLTNNYHAVNTTVLLRHTTGSPLSFGARISYEPSHSSQDLQRSTYSFTSSESDVKTIQLGAGVGYKTRDDFIAELDFFYDSSNAKNHSNSWTGSNTVEAQSMETTFHFFRINLGVEKWLLEHKFALRAGGSKELYASLSGDIITNTTGNKLYVKNLAESPNTETLTSGWEWVISKTISLEYALISDSSTTHNLGITYIF